MVIWICRAFCRRPTSSRDRNKIKQIFAKKKKELRVVLLVRSISDVFIIILDLKIKMHFLWLIVLLQFIDGCRALCTANCQSCNVCSFNSKQIDFDFSKNYFRAPVVFAIAA